MMNHGYTTRDDGYGPEPGKNIQNKNRRRNICQKKTKK